MDENNTNQATNHTKRNNWRGGFFALLAIIILGLAGGFYMYQAQTGTYNQKVSDLESQVANLQASQAQEDSSNNDQPTSQVISEDKQVEAAVKNYCAALVSDGKPREYKLGTTGSQQKKIDYSQDKQFAKLNVACHQAGVVPTGGGALMYMLKKVNGEWIVIYTSAQEEPEADTNFGVPNPFN